MSNFRSIPLTLAGSGADMRRITDAEEINLSYYAETMTVLAHPASNRGTVDSDSRNYQGSLDRYGTRVADSDMVQIGSYTDTFYNQVVGTHPATSLTQGTTITPLFQCYDSSSSVDYLNFPNTAGAERARLIALDSDGDFRELDSEQTIAFGKRLLETSLSNERTGSWRIGTSTPSGGTWEMWNNNAFTDTTSSASTNYNVYRKTGETDVDMKELLGLMDSVSSVVGDTGSSDIQEMGSIQQLIALSAATKLARINSELGKMVLLPSAQTPANTGETGTWQTRGSALDTVNTTEDIQYTSEYFTSISRTEDFSGTRQFVNRGSDQYTRYRDAVLPDDFIGQRSSPYAGSRTNQQNGEREQFVGQRFTHGNYSGQRTTDGNFVGTRQYDSFAKFIGIEQLDYVGTRQYSWQFGGTRQTETWATFIDYRYFVGNRLPAYDSFSGERQFGGYRTRQMLSLGMAPQQFSTYSKFTGVRPFAGTRQEYDRQFLGRRFYGPVLVFGIQYRGFAGDRNGIGQPHTTEESFNGERQISLRYSFTQVAGQDEQFAGQRQIDIQRFVGFDVQGTFVGDRQFSDQYTGPRDDTFAGDRYANYVGQYTGQYNAPYTRDYIGNFSTQYTGATLTNLASTLETYTLYCKVSES